MTETPLHMPQILARSPRLDDPENEGYRILLAAAWGICPRPDLSEFVSIAGAMMPQLRSADPRLLAEIAAGMDLPAGVRDVDDFDPDWSAAQSGLIGDASAIAGSAQINQLLGTHIADLVFPGNRILLPKYMYSTTPNPWNTPLAGLDVDQPFTLSGTSIGRIQLPVLAVGDGADLLVSLCADSAGHPGTVITQTRIPASWLTQTAAISAPRQSATEPPVTGLSGAPLAVSQFQTWNFADQTVQPYSYPAITFAGVSANPSTSFYSGQIISIGGVSNDTALTGVYTMAYDGTGVLSPSVPQPVFPEPNDGSSATCVAIDAQDGSAVVVNTGGGTSFGGAPVANVYTSTLDPVAGTLSAWTVQTALPAAVQSHTMAASGSYVYSVGGKNTGGLLNTVYYAQVQNGQITGWAPTTPLPVATQIPFVAVCNGLLMVAGGANASFTSYNTVWLARIYADGSVGPWFQGPSLFAASANLNANAFANDQGVIMESNGDALVFGPTGPSFTWAQDTAGGGGFLPGFYDFGDGSVMAYTLAPTENAYAYAYYNLVPYPSVPLPATGLTNGATYHVLLQQQGGGEADYLVTSVGSGTYGPSGVTALTSPAGRYAWTAQAAADAVAIQVFDNTPPAVPGLPLHTWEDGGARVTTVVCATTPDHRLLGVCEATRTNLALNANQGFESGLSPWTVTGGTVAQSSTQVFEGEFSAQVTPSGSDTIVYLQSELLACMPGQQVTASAWAWFTAAVSPANASCSINWYSLTGAYLSTDSGNVTVAAATWTELANTFTAPAGAYQFTINVALSGTPAASQIFYVDCAYATNLVTEQLPVVAALAYPDSWPGQTWPALGSTVLA